MKGIDKGVSALEQRVNVAFCPRRVDHEEVCVGKGAGVVIHEDAIVPVRILSDFELKGARISQFTEVLPGSRRPIGKWWRYWCVLPFET